ncbi:hypothetical protein [Aurantimonas marianensis]|uniref:Uncharacterized protein n=1 Tax=Aurantimonas marianensis TaxID=2920428 RepID=A0A9X2HDL4_9HYPH|nr:hypothetical protein [Aurantimonas marianensis]MCP3055019.1 hypothetical protein [Aurantimonas marianensis]
MSGGLSGFGTALGGLFGRRGPSRRSPAATAREGTETGGGGNSRRGAVDAEAPACSVTAGEGVTAGELVAGVHHGDIRRLVVVSTWSDRRRSGGVEIVRRLTASGLTCVLIDLTGEDHVATAMGLRPDCEGFATLAEGLSSLTDVIHRDHFTRAHVVPSAGYKIRSTDPVEQADLRLFLAAFAEAYECTVTEFDRNAVDRLPVILDEETALVVAGPPGVDVRSGDLVHALGAIGIEDLLFMESTGPSTGAGA